MNDFELTAGYPVRTGAVEFYYSLELSMMAGMNGMSIALSDSANHQITTILEYSYTGEKSIGSFIQALESFTRQEDIFLKPYRSEVIGIELPYSTLIPSALFDDQKLEEYLAFEQDIMPGQVYRSEELRVADIRNVYCLPRDLNDALKKNFPRAKIYHYATPLLSGLFLQVKKNPNPDAVYCQVRGDLYDLVIFRSGRLEFSNTFHYSNKEEFIYYILFVLEQLGMNSSGQGTILLGDADKDPEMIILAREYLGDVSFWAGDPDRPEDLTDMQVPWHRYFNLLSLRLCV